MTEVLVRKDGGYGEWVTMEEFRTLLDQSHYGDCGSKAEQAKAADESLEND